MIHTCKCGGRVVPKVPDDMNVAKFECDHCHRVYHQRKRRSNGQIRGYLQIDRDRGVIYFHSLEGRSLLRICRLPKVPDNVEMIDITHMYGVSYSG